MALLKTLEHKKTGVELTYWRITRAEIDGLRNSTRIFLSGYISAEARAAGKLPLDSVSFEWRGADNPVTPTILMQGLAYAACYAKVKAQAASIGISNPVLFNDATDI